MSTELSLCCHQCRVKIWIAQEGLSGETFYSSEPRVMAALKTFLFAHRDHPLVFADDQQYEAYDDLAWQP